MKSANRLKHIALFLECDNCTRYNYPCFSQCDETLHSMSTKEYLDNLISYYNQLKLEVKSTESEISEVKEILKNESTRNNSAK